MSVNAIDATRAYINDARSRNIGALSPIAVARRLSVTEDQAIALLNCIAETEGLIKINGYIGCPECNEVISLKGKSLSAIVSEAEALADTRCPLCDNTLASNSDLKVKLSFFCVAVKSDRNDLAAVPISRAEPAQTISADLTQLRGIQGINCHNLILASDGSTVLVGENVSQAASGGVISPHSVQSNTAVSQTVNILALENKKRADELIRSNPWISGSFYLTVVVVIMATLMVAGKILSPWALPPIFIAAVLLVCVVGAFQLRNDSKLSETNFLTLMRMTFRGLPLIRSFRKPESSE